MVSQYCSARFLLTVTTIRRQFKNLKIGDRLFFVTARVFSRPHFLAPRPTDFHESLVMILQSLSFRASASETADDLRALTDRINPIKHNIDTFGLVLLPAAQIFQTTG
jgi:hypothetical protein